MFILDFPVPSKYRHCWIYLTCHLLPVGREHHCPCLPTEGSDVIHPKARIRYPASKPHSRNAVLEPELRTVFHRHRPWHSEGPVWRVGSFRIGDHHGC